MGVYVLALGVLLYVLGLAWAIRFLTAVSLLVVLGGLSLSVVGTKSTRAIIFPIFFLIFMIPLPFMQELGFTLQKISVDSSAWLLNIFGLSVTTTGPDIHLGDIIFTIGLPCSGINTLIALLALAAVYTYLLSGPFYKKFMLFAFAFPLAILANILRITSIITVAKYHGVEVATGFYHDLSSPLFFILAFLFLILLSRILKCRIGFGDLRK
jgi:exosortase